MLGRGIAPNGRVGPPGHPLPPCRAARDRGFGSRPGGNLRLKPRETPALNPEPLHPDDIYASNSVLEPYIGAVEVCLEPGKGRAVRATRSVKMGQLLMIARPAALLTCPPSLAGEQPSAGDLFSSLTDPPERWQAAVQALGVLGDGSTGSMRSLVQLPSLASCRYTSAAGAVQTPGEEPGPAAEAAQRPQLSKAVDLNAFGEPWPDVAAWTCRGQGRGLRSFVGVWPAMAMMNHSCCPNACTLVLQSPRQGAAAAAAPLQCHRGDEAAGGAVEAGEWLMVVRSARDIKAGEEVTIAYTGRFTSSPLKLRQALLQASFGFSCSCARCAAEAQAAPGAAGKLSQLHDALEAELKPRVMRALEAEDARQLQQLQAELINISRRIQELIMELPSAGNVRPYLHSWVYMCYELLGLCAEAQQQQQQQRAGVAGGRGAATGRRRAAGGAGAAPRRGLGGARGLRRSARGSDDSRGAAGSNGAASGSSGTSAAAAAAAAAAARTALDSMSVRLHLLQAVSPGSYQHAAMSARFLARSQELTGYNSDTQAALEACVDAHVARYGRVGAETLARLVDAHEDNELVDLLAEGASGAGAEEDDPGVGVQEVEQPSEQGS